MNFKTIAAGIGVGAAVMMGGCAKKAPKAAEALGNKAMNQLENIQGAVTEIYLKPDTLRLSVGTINRNKEIADSIRNVKEAEFLKNLFKAIDIESQNKKIADSIRNVKEAEFLKNLFKAIEKHAKTNNSLKPETVTDLPKKFPFQVPDIRGKVIEVPQKMVDDVLVPGETIFVRDSNMPLEFLK